MVLSVSAYRFAWLEVRWLVNVTKGPSQITYLCTILRQFVVYIGRVVSPHWKFQQDEVYPDDALIQTNKTKFGMLNISCTQGSQLCLHSRRGEELRGTDAGSNLLRIIIIIIKNRRVKTLVNTKYTINQGVISTFCLCGALCSLNVYTVNSHSHNHKLLCWFWIVWTKFVCGHSYASVRWWLRSC